MARLADASMIQYRLLNKSRGAAVQSPRVQVDKNLYSSLAKHCVEMQKNLYTFQDTVVDIITSEAKFGKEQIQAVLTERGRIVSGRSVIVGSGTFMGGQIYVGE